jgi:glycosyltransferase involved in cell wall biosynthesis
MPGDRINVLYLSSFGTLKWGGQKSLFHLVTRLDRKKFHPVVLLPTEEDLAQKLRELNIDIVIQEIPPVNFSRLFAGFNALFSLLRVIKKYRIDLIHTDGPRNTFYAGLAAKLKRIPLIWHVRASNRDRFDGILTFFPEKIILVANSLRSRFPGIGRDDRFVTIYNGVDLAEFKKNGPSDRIKKSLGIEESDLLLTVFARVEPLKGQKYLIEACGSLLSGMQKFRIFFAGEIKDKEYQRECLDLAESLNIRERIVFAGFRSDIGNILSQTDIVLLPSLFEAFPRAVIEGMAAGKAVIATDAGGAAEAVEDGVTGFVVPPKDPAAIAEKILLLAGDEKMRLRMGSAGRLRAEKLFSIEENVRETERVYHELLGR